jgi:two-component system, NarL family, nitrate/nitrite response regulator NarL
VVAEPLAVLIVAEDTLARAGLAALLADEPAVSAVGRVAAGDDLSAAVALYRPAVLLWDLGWNAQSSLDRLTSLADVLPPVAVLLADAPDAPDAWRAGARGLLRRDAPTRVITAALLALAEGVAVIEPDFAPALAGFSARDPEQPALVEPLTARELEVLRLLAEGLPNKTIAQRLRISEHTVKFHVNAILGKLGVSSRTEAVVRATRLGLLFL